jgi:4-amino-4-deoxy-L-arabinose transferase-like glycosyltransferase
MIWFVYSVVLAGHLSYEEITGEGGFSFTEGILYFIGMILLSLYKSFVIIPVVFLFLYLLQKARLGSRAKKIILFIGLTILLFLCYPLPQYIYVAATNGFFSVLEYILEFPDQPKAFLLLAILVSIIFTRYIIKKGNLFSKPEPGAETQLIHTKS